MDLKKLLDLVAQLSVLRLFPSDPGGRVAVAKQLLAMCDNWERAQWLVRRMGELFNEWPGPLEFRAVYCSRYKPKDGKEADTSDARFAEEGFPQELPATESRPQLPDPEGQEFARRTLRDAASQLKPLTTRRQIKSTNSVN